VLRDARDLGRTSVYPYAQRALLLRKIRVNPLSQFATMWCSL
jgi:hypothetical protein